MIFDEIPLGEVELDRRELDVDHIRARDDHVERLGTVQIRTVAVHRDTGEIVGNTVIYARDDADHARQAITIVNPAHRGHRLGLLIKLANLRYLREHHSHVAQIWAGNADTNAPMVAINDRLGFEPVEARVSYKRTLEE